jgi:uncharacterized protein YecE (DUF72 family)
LFLFILLKNISAFLSRIKRNNLVVGWEPRGDWREHEDEVKRICDDYGLVHVVDPFRWKPLDGSGIFYFRLHGIGKGEVNYSYRYTDEDLKRLKEITAEILESKREGYVMFNNVSMADDAFRFVKLLEG